MKPFNENDLIAYHLHELPSRRARALERAMQADPSLAAESLAYATMLRSFKDRAPLDINEEIVDRNWESLWSKLQKQPVRPAISSRWLIPALSGIGLAFAATSFFITMHRHAAVPPTNGVHPLRDAAQAMSITEGPLDNPTSSIAANEIRRSMRHESIPSATLNTTSPTALLRPAPSRIVTSFPEANVAPDSLARLAPPAITFAPALSELGSPPISLETTTPPQVLASDNPSAPSHRHNAAHREHPLDVTLAMGGTLIGTRDASSNGASYSQGATHAVSAIAALHQQLRPAVGYQVAVSYTRPDFLYGSAGGQTDIDGRIYEVAGTYVLQGPHRGIASTAVEGGAGLMAFLPSTSSPSTGNNLRGAGIVGVTADLALSKYLAIRAGYRLQVFKGPDFQSTGNIAPAVATILISNEPMVGITYRFSHK